MTTFSGTLNINPRGAQLQCHLGSFIIRDERLANLGDGKHRGFFEVQKNRFDYGSKTATTILV